jgi:two-component system sensor histidine kinase CpxA
VRVDCPTDCWIEASPELIRSAIENVVRNAIRYTAPGTEVEIAVSCSTQQGVEVRVRDHGEGVPESELPNIFQPFYRLAAARDRVSGGTGLGLAISQRAFKVHGGSLAAANAPGGGLVVWMRLPAAVVTSTADAVPQAG